MELPTIGGKEIVPVRLIPFVLSAIPGMATIPGILAQRLNLNGFLYDPVNGRPESRSGSIVRAILGTEREESPRGDNGLRSYSLDHYDVPVEMAPSEWDEIYRDGSYSISLDSSGRVVKFDGTPYLWRREISKFLPPGIFIWREELDSLGRQQTLFTRDLNIDAYISSECQGVVWEGFEHLMPNATPPLPPVAVANTPGDPMTRGTIEEEYNRLGGERLGKEEMAYTLFAMGFQNNAIGVALGKKFRPGSNAIASWVVRLRKKHEKTLGG